MTAFIAFPNPLDNIEVISCSEQEAFFSICQKAKKWLDASGIEYTERPIKEKNPSIEEIKAWHQMSGLPLKKFFNTSDLLFITLYVMLVIIPSGIVIFMIVI